MASEEFSSSSSTSNTVVHLPTALRKRKAGRKKFKETRHPIYKGVRQRNGKWVCELRQPNKKCSVWVGTFSCPDIAARAYDVAALALKGESTALNFPDLAYSLPRVSSSSSISHIRCTAIEAAESFFARNVSLPLSLSSCASIPEKKVFIDEEEVFNMPGIIAGMAEGLIMTPPGMKRGFDWDEFDNNTMGLSLWSDGY